MVGGHGVRGKRFCRASPRLGLLRAVALLCRTPLDALAVLLPPCVPLRLGLDERSGHERHVGVERLGADPVLPAVGQQTGRHELTLLVRAPQHCRQHETRRQPEATVAGHGPPAPNSCACSRRKVSRSRSCGTTNDRLISLPPMLISSGEMSPSAANTCCTTPGVVRRPSPTTAMIARSTTTSTLAMSRSAATSRATGASGSTVPDTANRRAR